MTRALEIEAPAAKPKAPDKMRLVNAETKTWAFGEWEDKPAAVKDTYPLTGAEEKALIAKHGSKNVNWLRAKRVKCLLVLGQSKADIPRLLKYHGNGYGVRQIKKDLSALSPPPPKR